jgi:hypothetical protein
VVLAAQDAQADQRPTAKQALVAFVILVVLVEGLSVVSGVE